MNDLNDITSGSSNRDKTKLLNDLNEELRQEDDAFENEAAEGLRQIPAGNIQFITDKLNADLHRHLSKNKRKKKRLPDQSITYISIIIILLLVVVGYFVLRKLMN